MQRLLLVYILVAWSVVTFGQRRLVVVDVETRVPIRGVNVVSSAHRVDTTDWQGFINIPDTCRSLSFSHVKYESRILNLSEVKDTVFLISKLMGLSEVVVLGKGKNDDKLKELKNSLRLDPVEAQLLAADPSQGVNVGGMIKWIAQKLFKRRKETKKERFKRMLEEY
jgi:hypothetical protein